MKTTKLFLHLLSQLVKSGDGQRHNLTIDNEDDLVLTMMCGDQHVHFFLRDEEMEFIQDDYVTAAEQVAEETKEFLRQLTK